MNTKISRFWDIIIGFLKKETVLVISLFLAIISMLFVFPNKEYINYIDFRVLCVLFMLMLVVCALNNIGFLDRIAKKLISKVLNFRQLYIVLVLLCFFSSMFITNDVALITFVPFTINVLSCCKMKKKMIRVIVMETIAANLGSMLTPIGNPQNLFIYSNYNMDIKSFFIIMLPYATSALILIIALIIFDKDGKSKIESIPNIIVDTPRYGLKVFYFLALFALALLVVVFKFDYRIITPIVVLLVVIINYRLLFKVDYSLLMTFVFFFIFIGNSGQIESIKETLILLVNGNEFAFGLTLSQIFSNVPATMLLSGFTKNNIPLLIGVNIGGLGTLIASMASLISYKFYANEQNSKKLNYLLEFTILNILFMTILVVIYIIF